MKVQDKYAQAEVVAFWTCFAQSGLQRAESIMLARYAPPPPARVLDLGCGAGRITLALEPSGYEVVGLDISAAMLSSARCICTGVGGEFVQADLRDLPFARESFALALVFIAALQHVSGRAQRQSALQQIARALKGDGVLILALDNVSAALLCYASWAWQRLRSGRSVEPGMPRETPYAARAAQPADSILASNRTRTGALGWHARGVVRSLRWRTWEGLRDRARALRVVGGEAGDTCIDQVSLLPTRGKVYYHLYRHAELIADAQIAGLRLLGYHSARELSEDKTFDEVARRFDKQVMYAFRKVS